MTYIIAGNFNGNNFLKVDSYTNNDPKKERNEKTFYSAKLNGYFSLTGRPIIMDIIKIYDIYCSQKGLKEKVNQEFFELIIEEYISVCKQLDCEVNNECSRIYFLNKTDLIYYHVLIDKFSKEKDEFIRIPENSFIMCMSNKIQKLDRLDSSISDFCKSQMENFQKNYGSSHKKLNFDKNCSFINCSQNNVEYQKINSPNDDDGDPLEVGDNTLREYIHRHIEK